MTYNNEKSGLGGRKGRESPGMRFAQLSKGPRVYNLTFVEKRRNRNVQF